MDESEEEDLSDIHKPDFDINQLNEEIAELNSFIEMARSIDTDTKSTTLLDALTTGFEEMRLKGANRKALIFTESRRTGLFNAFGSQGYPISCPVTRIPVLTAAVYKVGQKKHYRRIRVPYCRKNA